MSDICTIFMAAWLFALGYTFFFPREEPSQADQVRAANDTLAAIKQVVAYKELAASSSIEPDAWNWSSTPPVNEIERWPVATIDKLELCRLFNQVPEPGLTQQLNELRSKSATLGVCYRHRNNDTWLPTAGEWEGKLLSPRQLGPIAWLGRGLPTAKGYKNLYWSSNDHAWFGQPVEQWSTEKISAEKLSWPLPEHPAETKK